MIVGTVIANVIDPVYHKASTKVYRHNYKDPGRGFVDAVQDVVVVCSLVDCGDIGPVSESGVETTGRTVDAEPLEADMTSLKELRGLPSSLNYLSAETDDN
jgi:hypothetical protein